jgi:hypothetical protein
MNGSTPVYIDREDFTPLTHVPPAGAPRTLWFVAMFVFGSLVHQGKRLTAKRKEEVLKHVQAVNRDFLGGYVNGPAAAGQVERAFAITKAGKNNLYPSQQENGEPHLVLYV